MNNTSVKKNWFRIFSPAMIALVLPLIAFTTLLIRSLLFLLKTGSWNYGLLLGWGIACILLLTLDKIAKLYISNTTWLLWAVEVIIIGLLFYFDIVHRISSLLW